MNIPQFRKNLREAFNAAENGEVVEIVRHGRVYHLVVTPFSILSTDEVSSNIRPATAPPANPFIDEVGYVSEKDLENLKIGKGVEVSSTPAGKKNKLVGFANAPSKIELDNKLKSFAADKKMKFCANGHAIPAGRSKCMGKGCKYA